MATLKPKIIWPELASLPANLDDSPEVVQIVRLKMQLLSNAKITQKLGAPPGFVAAVLKLYGFDSQPAADKPAKATAAALAKLAAAAVAAPIPPRPGKKKPRALAPSKVSAGALLTTKRRLAAFELRLQSKTFDEIAEDLGISKPAAWQLVKGAKADHDDAVGETEADVKFMHLMRYERMCATFLPLALAGDEKAAAVVLKVMDAEAKVHGLYAASKTELTGAGGGPLQSVTATNFDLSKLSDEDLRLMETLVLAASAPSPTNPGP